MVAFCLLLGACSSGTSTDEGSETDPGTSPTAGIRIPAPEATGLVVTPEGTVLAASRTTGNVVEITPGTGETETRVAIPGVDASLAQGGLLGLVIDGDNLIASYTNDEGRLIVAKLFETVLAEDAASGRIPSR